MNCVCVRGGEGALSLSLSHTHTLSLSLKFLLSWGPFGVCAHAKVLARQVEKKDLVGALHANIVINYVSKVTGGKLNSVVAHEFTSISEN